MGETNLGEAWRRLRLEFVAVKSYPRSFMLYAGTAHRDPILDQALPAMFYVRAVGLLDKGLEMSLGTNDQRRKLFDLIESAADRGLVERSALHALRERRNLLAHEAHGWCEWDETEQAIATIEEVLSNLCMVEPPGTLEWFGERSAMRNSDKPDVRFERDFIWGVKQNGHVALEVSFTQLMDGVAAD